MPSTEGNSHGAQPTPTGQIGHTGHPLPRRASPANSITLRHHRLAREASSKASQGSAPVKETNTASPRRNSSGDSNETGQSDPKNWFDQSNQNPTATFDNSIMEVDPPFFQKESDSSNEDKPFGFGAHLNPPQRTGAQSSSADDYRSVIDDLTVEIQRLKEELKRYKQSGPDMLRKEKLFEIKVHGLPQKKKRELEATLRDFAASLEGSPASSSQKRKKSSRHTNHDHVYSGSGSLSKHASSSSGSNIRPADSAYASMSTGAKSSGTSLNRPMMNTKDANEKKVQNYLRDIPEGLYPRHMVMTDKERKKLVVRRLEQLFTGKIGGRHAQNVQVSPAEAKRAQLPITSDPRPSQLPKVPHEATNESEEPSREAKILLTEQQSRVSGKKSRSRDNGSASNSHGYETESGGNGNSSGSGANQSPPMPEQPEQRPTRPRDLDPDRVQVPSENMSYIRHLGLIPPELLEMQLKPAEDVRPDAEGWVYLNLLCNLAQLHIINVTPDFVRLAVSEISTKFQLSPDGRKIRWRGGTEGTRFSSDSSGYNSQKSPSTDDNDDPKKSSKRQKTGRTTGDGFQSGSSSKNASKFGQIPASSESFHYKPIFAQRESSGGQTSIGDTLSSFGPPEDSNVGDSRWGMSGSGTSNRKKRRHDGAIIYYSGAPFCTDLSGDPGDISPPSRMLASSHAAQDHSQVVLPRSPSMGENSGSLIRPLSDRGHFLRSISEMDVDGDKTPSLIADDTDNLSDVELELVWSDENQYLELTPLEPSGLGGVLPDDHFVVVVTTKRSKHDAAPFSKAYHRPRPDEATDSIICRLATMSTSSPTLRAARVLPHTEPQSIEIEYASGGIKRLAPAPLPPPAIFVPPFSTDDSASGDMYDSDDIFDTESSEELISRRANPHQSDDYPDGVDLSSGDEDGEDPDDSPNDHNMYDVDGDGNPQILPSRSRVSPLQMSSSAAAAAGTARGGSKSTIAEAMPPADGSSVATAGGIESGYSSSENESG